MKDGMEQSHFAGPARPLHPKHPPGPLSPPALLVHGKAQGEVKAIMGRIIGQQEQKPSLVLGDTGHPPREIPTLAVLEPLHPTFAAPHDSASNKQIM